MIGHAMAKPAKGVVRSIVDRLAATTEAALHVFERGSGLGEDFFRRLLKNLPGMVYRCRTDAAWTMEFVGPGCRELTGFRAHDLTEGRVASYRDLIHPDDRGRVIDALQQAVRSATSFQVGYRLRGVDGRERRVWEQGCAVTGPDGAVEAVEGFVTDVTAHFELAARAADREGQFRALVEGSLVGVYVVRGGRFTYANPRLGEIFGYTTDELLALPSALDIVHPEDRDLVAANLRRRLEGEVEALRYEFRGRRRDGTERHIEVHGRRVELEGEPTVVGTLLDVTQRKRHERRYSEIEKMNALGRLAGGVAHDLNNFLALIKTTAELVAMERPEDDALHRDMTEIVSATERGAALGRQLTHFGKTRRGPETQVCIESLLHDLSPGLQRLLGADIALNVHVEPVLPPVRLDPTHADEVLMNLIVNARDAMPHGGAVRVTARRLRQKQASGSRSGLRDEVVIEVADTGVGIPSQHLRHIFEPYYTTKGEAGTGLGLANVWRIVTDAGGVVEVVSEPGAGATFRVCLPVVPAEDTPSPHSD